MPGVNVLGFNHTSFTVANLDRAVAYFRDFLGFELVSRGPRDGRLMERMTGLRGVDVSIALLRGPGHTIELIHYRSPASTGPYSQTISEAGMTHVALNVDDVGAVVTGSAPYGFYPVGEVITIDAGPNRGRRVVYLRSPDGIMVEFVEQPPARHGRS